MKYMRRLSIFIVIWSFFVISPQVWAQGNKPINVYITVMRPNPNLEDRVKNPWVPFSGCEIYFFDTKNKAQQFYNTIKLEEERNGMASIVKDNNFSWKDKLTTDQNGVCEASAVGSTWYIVAVRETYLSKGVISINGNTDITIEVISNVRELQNITKTEKLKQERTKVRSLSLGDTQVIQADIQIFPEERNSTFRYGITPFTTVAKNSYSFTSAGQQRTPKIDSLFKTMRPYVIDGKAFDRTQLRKMGYDRKNDPLADYVDRSQKVKTHDMENDSIAFHIFEVLRPINPNALYPTYGYLWYENYGNLVVTDTILIDAGYIKSPMRFLDFSFPEVDINKGHYHIQPKREAQTGDAQLDIEFVTGKAEVLSTDTVGKQKLYDIVHSLENIYNEPTANLYSIKIHGYASPEGGRNVNENLCRQRADYIKQKVMAHLGGVTSEIESSVASWRDVAALLRADSIDDPENVERAQQIEDIIASSRDIHQIDARMQASPLYKYLKANEYKYYKPLRKVVISYVYTMQRILTREEVINRYERGREANLPYQYEYLFEYLKDQPQKLEVVSKKALRDGPQVAGKSWALAAYYLAKSYTARDTCDASLLKPYIALSDRDATKEVPYSRFVRSCSTLLNSEHVDEDGVFLQYMNDEGVIMQQITMLLKANKVLDAFVLSDNLLPDEDPKYTQTKNVLECLDGNWTVPEVRDIVASTSEWNKVVVYAAQDDNPGMDEAYWEDAWNLLNDSTIFTMKSARELYMKATLAHRLFTTAKNWNSRKDNMPVPKEFFDTSGFSVYGHPQFSDDTYPWGAAMVKACEMNPELIETLKFDGEFSQNYRDGFAAYWNEIHPDKLLK